MTVFLLPFQNGCLFSCLYFWAWDFQYYVSKSGESEHPCLVPKLRGKAFSFSPLCMILTGTSQVAIVVKNLPAIAEEIQIQVHSLSQGDPLEDDMATHSSILAWRITWTEESGRLQSIGSQRVGQNWSIFTGTHTDDLRCRFVICVLS